MNYKNVISVSGGKDSTAMLILAKSRGFDFRAVFADTGNEHEITIEYLEYLENALDIKIERYKADFSQAINKRRETLINHLINLDAGSGYGRRLKQWTGTDLLRVIDNLHATGNPFLDLCMLKGRFPSSRAQFCTEELKRHVIDFQVMLPLLNECNDDRTKIISWQGVRKQESHRRSSLTHSEIDELCIIYRPILELNHNEIFALHKKHNIKPNPLYTRGMNRVGCMPCINAGKAEMKQVSLEAYQHINKIAEWEQKVALCSKRGKATFFQVGDVPGWPKELELIDITKHGIKNYVSDYAVTSRGGRQQDMITNMMEPGICRSNYGLCE